MTNALSTGTKAKFGDARLRSRLLKLGVLLVAIAAFAGLTVLTFLAMAGHPNDWARWPTTFELHYVDNPFLWLIARDVVEGQPVEFWSSGQDFLFPAFLISLASYLITSGDIHWYYVVVAALNNAALFTLIFAIARHVDRASGFWRQLTLTFAASLPLLVGTFSGASLVFVLHLAPNYNFDLDVGILLAALILLARTTASRVTFSVLFVFVAASNLLTILFTVPVAVIVLALKYFRSGVAAVHRSGIWFVATVAAALGLNAVLFRLPHPDLPFSIRSNQTKSYVDFGSVGERMNTVVAQFQTAAAGNLIMIFATMCVVTSLIAAIVAIRRYFRDASAGDVQLGRVFLLLFPVVGAAAAYAVTLLYDWYLWPLIVGSQVVCLLLLIPRRARLAVAAIGTAGVLVFTLGGGNLARSADTYFAVRAPGVACVDDHVASDSVIYAKNFNGKIVASQTTKHIRVIQLYRGWTVAEWLNNVAEASEYHGEIHEILLDTPGPGADADAADYMADARAAFGEPDEKITCAADAGTERRFELWRYERNINITSGARP
ncbi:MAG TPA: hypothetical protein VFU07_00330 [Candidatus Lumbricidophila sp.]|nr:hypothetical protein [Candidatus Lumbricidophila sp.]